MDPDVNVTDLRDWSTFEQGGRVKQQRRAIFYIGTKYGPFTEYFDRDSFTLAELEARIALLRSNLPNNGL
jgi:hypothetical protein